MIQKIILPFFFLGMVYVFLLIISRNPLITDDVYPGNSCPSLLEKSDVIYVIPSFDGNETDIIDNSVWCTQIRSLNKTIGLHGIRHTYHEFLYPISQEEIVGSMESFKQCFGYMPKLFRPPYNALSEKNEKKILALGMEVYATRYFLHPYCHCNPHSWMKVLNTIIFC